MGTGGIGRGIGNVRWRGWSRWCRVGIIVDGGVRLGAGDIARTRSNNSFEEKEA